MRTSYMTTHRRPVSTRCLRIVNRNHLSSRQKLAYTILIEVLVYHQFTSPVRWIKTQDLPFMHERLIELGPGLVLTGMATRTLKAKY
jgi:malonyl CoA-acyl carrier protein transacylase